MGLLHSLRFVRIIEKLAIHHLPPVSAYDEALRADGRRDRAGHRWIADHPGDHGADGDLAGVVVTPFPSV